MPAEQFSRTPSPSVAQQQALLATFDAIVIDRDPMSAMETLRQAGTLVKAIPAYAECWSERGKQDVRWHPEGDVWQHTLKVMNGLRHTYDLEVRLAGAFHDFGKPSTQYIHPEGTISNHGHEYVGAFIFEKDIGPRFGLDDKIIKNISWLITHHMFMQNLHVEGRFTKQMLIRLLKNELSDKLLQLHVADVTGTGIPPEKQRNNAALAVKLKGELE